MSEPTNGAAPADQYDGGVSAADFTGLDVENEPDGPEAPPREIPEGMTVDRQTGELRPKRAGGRPRKDAAAPEPAPRPKTADELKARGPLPDPGPDKPPQEVRRSVLVVPPAAEGPEPDMPRAGTIAKAVNKLYRRAGRIVRAMDHDIGQALIECATADPEGDWPTTGEAWEQLARNNSAIRAFLLRAIAGNDWMELAMAHAPLGMAIILKPAIAKRVPIWKLLEAFRDEGEDGEDQAAMLAGLSEADLQAMAAQAGMDMDRIAQVAATMPMSPEMAEKARQAAERLSRGSGITPGYQQHDLADDDLPAGLRRSQPKRTTRAQRTTKAGSK